MPRLRRRGWQGEEIQPSRLEEIAEVARKAGDWSVEKLAILDYYIGYGRGGFLNASQSAMHRYYVDGYAGPGKVRFGKAGPLLDASPLIALSAGVPPAHRARGISSDGKIRFTKGFLVEASAKFEATLRSRLSMFPADRWDLLRGDFNVLSPGIFAQIEAPAPVLAFLDLEDLDDIDFQTLQHIAGLPQRKFRVELLVTLPIGRIGQASANLDAVIEHLARMTGDEAGIRAIFDPYPKRSDIDWPAAIADVVELFRGCLSGLGYKYVLPAHPLPRTYPINFLIFATDHDLGAQLMRAAFNPETRRRRELQEKLKL